MSSDLPSCQRDVDSLFHVALSCELQLNAEKCCVMGFARKKSSINRWGIAQFGMYYIHGVGLPFVDGKPI